MVRFRGALAVAVFVALAAVLSMVPAPTMALKIRDWATLGHNRVRVPLTQQFPTVHSLVELERYYRDRAKAVPDVMTYNHVEEADNPALKPKPKTSVLCTLIGWCSYDPPTCDPECKRDSYLPVIRLTNRKSAKPDKEKRKIMIVSNPNAGEAIATDEWVAMFVKYMTFDWHEIEKEIGLERFWDFMILYYLDPEMNDIFGGWGMYKHKPPPKTEDELKDELYKEDNNMLDIENMRGIDIKDNLINWTKELLDEFTIVILPLNASKMRKPIEKGDYCAHNSTDFTRPYYDFDVFTDAEPYRDYETYSSTRIIEKVARSEKPEATIGLYAQGNYAIDTGTGREKDIKPKFLDPDMHDRLEALTDINDIRITIRGCCDQPAGGTMIDWFFEKLKVPLALDFGIYSSINQGLGIGTKYKKNVDHVADEVLKGHKFDGNYMPDNFQDDQIEYHCLQLKMPITPEQKGYMMMRWIVTVHQLAREMYNADTWKQAPKETIRNSREIRPITMVVMVVLVVVFLLVNSIVKNPDILRRYVD